MAPAMNTLRSKDLGPAGEAPSPGVDGPDPEGGWVDRLGGRQLE